MLRQVFYTLFISLIFFGCRDELGIEEPVVEPSVPWQEDERFLFETKVQTNTHSDGDRIYFMGRNHFSTIGLLQDDTIESVEHAIQWLQYYQHARMPISDELFVTANLNTVRIGSTREPVLQGASQFLHLDELDPEFKNMAFPSFWLSEAIGVNDHKECLITYWFETEDGQFGIRALKVRVAFNSDFMEIEETSTINITDSGFSVRSIYSIGRDFIITTDRKTYLLDESNQLLEVSETPLFNIFQIGNQWFGVFINTLYRSGDGRSWTEVGEIDRPLELISYDVLEGRTIGVYNSQLFVLELESDIIQITELNNDGLFGHKITSVDTFNGKVYVATLSGVFVKDLEDFWEEKVIEEG